jgi:hypothetical protein
MTEKFGFNYYQTLLESKESSLKTFLESEIESWMASDNRFKWFYVDAHQTTYKKYFGVFYNNEDLNSGE